MKLWGIDVSKYNYPINWNKVKDAGVKFVIIRCGYAPIGNRSNLQKDPYFETFYEGAKAANIPVGVYFYSRCNSVATAKEEAKFIINCLKGKKLEYPVWLDVEDTTTLRSTSRSTMTTAVKTCLDELEKAGYYVGIYSGKYILRDELIDSELKDYDHWIAAYTKTCPYEGKYTMWQFGGETNLLRAKKIDGIGSDVADQNYCYVDYPSIIKKLGKNGYVKEVPKKDTPKKEEPIKKPEVKTYKYKVTADVLNVRKGSGTDYKVVDTLKKDKVVTIIEIKNGWGKISQGHWISLKYCKKL